MSNRRPPTHEESVFGDPDQSPPQRFIAMLRSRLGDGLGDRQLVTRISVLGGADAASVFVTLYNLPSSVNTDKAEAENNRMTFVVGNSGMGFGALKVKVEQLMSTLPREYKLRSKTASIDDAAGYLAEFIANVVRKVPPNYTHTPPHLQPRERVDNEPADPKQVAVLKRRVMVYLLDQHGSASEQHVLYYFTQRGFASLSIRAAIDALARAHEVRRDSDRLVAA